MVSNHDAEMLLSFRDRISTQFGIHFPRERIPDLTRKLEQFAEKNHYAGATQHLIAELQKCTIHDEPLQRFVESLTIGETYFFREEETLDIVVNQLVPTLAKQNAREIKIWSAGCATGEEPYSLAMLLDTHQSDLKHIPVHLFATDLNRQSLEKAKTGIYKGWSFRNTSEVFLNRYFRKESDSSYHLHPDIKGQIKFSQLNLAHSDFGMVNSHLNQVDVILCRNVLMYFSENTILKIVKQFSERLKPDGYLIISQTECTHYFQPYFEIVQIGQAFLFRKKGSATNSHAQQTAALSPPVYYRSENVISPKREITTTAAVLAKENKKISSQDLIRKARQLADQGMLDEALSNCVEALQSQKLDIQAHYLHAMILQELERFDEAKQALRRVLFLQPDMLMATYALASIEQKSGKRKEALRHFDNLYRTLTLFQDEDPIPYSDNLSARQLREMLMQFRTEN